MANTIHPATCGTCGGSGVTYKQTNEVRMEWIEDGDRSHREVTLVEMLEERTCSTCGGKGTK